MVLQVELRSVGLEGSGSEVPFAWETVTTGGTDPHHAITTIAREENLSPELLRIVFL